jgi:hypothetical protein
VPGMSAREFKAMLGGKLQLSHISGLSPSVAQVDRLKGTGAPEEIS